MFVITTQQMLRNAYHLYLQRKYIISCIFHEEGFVKQREQNQVYTNRIHSYKCRFKGITFLNRIQCVQRKQTCMDVNRKNVIQYKARVTKKQITCFKKHLHSNANIFIQIIAKKNKKKLNVIKLLRQYRYTRLVDNVYFHLKNAL